MSFGENLANLRKQKGWSQDDLANNLNLSRQAISKWENNQSKPDVDNVQKISKAFGIKIDDLLDNDIPKEKAVTLEVKKAEKKEKAIVIVKLIIIAVIILYVISVVYKFASLLIIVNGVQKYANLDNYHYIITTYDENGLVEKEECWFKDGVSKTENTTLDFKTIIAINYNSNEGYMMSSIKNEKVNINLDEYKNAHQTYACGGQLVDTLPKVITEKSIFDLLLNSFTMNSKVELYDEGMIIQSKNSYITLDREKLLPTMMYSDSNKKVITYYLEINNNKTVEI